MRVRRLQGAVFFQGFAGNLGAARQQMGMLIERGYGWRTLFVFAAIVAALMLLASMLKAGRRT